MGGSLTGVLVVTLSLLDAYAVFSPLPALVAAVLAERAHRRGERHMGWLFAFALVCFAAGFWSLANLWDWLP